MVYEFWTRKPQGVCRGQFTAEALAPSAVRMYAIRRKLDRPQIASTSRHISQGGVDLLDVQWDSAAKTMKGQSAVVYGDPYAITLHIPEGLKIHDAEMDRQKVLPSLDGRWATINITPRKTGAIAWIAQCE